MQNVQNLQSLVKSQTVSNSQKFTNYVTSLSGLIAYYPLDESSGNAINKAPSTFGTLNGTITGATQGVSGQLGNSYSFDGVNDFISIADNAVFDSLSQATVFFMVKKNTASSFNKVIFKNAVFDIGISDSGVIFGEFNGIGNPGGWGDTEIDDNSWHFCAITYNGSAINCYVDGVNVETVGSLTGSLGNGSGALEIGRHADNQNEYFAGLIQHVGILNTALTDSEILRIAELFF